MDGETTRNETVHFNVSGRVTIDGGDDALRRKVDALLREGRRRIVLHLEGVPYADSAGLATLLACHRRVEAAGGTMTLVNPTPRVDDVLRLTGLDRALRVERRPGLVVGF